MKKTLVTGGAGFIGSHLVERLLADGHEVTVLDDFSTGNPNNLKNLEGDSGLNLHQLDITEYEAILNSFIGIDWVFHLAARADIVPSIQKPLEYNDINVKGTISVLEAARAANVKRFIYAASSSCYGTPDDYPTPETSPIRAMYPYALTKNLGEQYVMHWNQIYGMPTVVLRFFNVYGPRTRTSGAYGAVFGVFLAQKLAGKPFTVVGDGTQTRDFTYVTDVADSLIAAAESDVAGEVFNVGSGNTYEINHLVGLMGGEVVYVPQRPGEPDCTFADTAKIRRIIGWEPKVSFEQGVANMLDVIDHWAGAPVWDSESISDATKEWFQYLGDDVASKQETRS